MAIELHGVDLETRGGRLLNGVDAHLRAGRVHALVGPGGAGKSALIALLAGLLPPAAGRLTLLGLPQPGGRRQVRGRLAALFQEEAPYPRQEVQGYLRWFGKLFGISNTETDSKALDLMRRLHIEHLWRRRLDHLHPGGQRLVATVRALLPHLPLTLLDEPFAALDPVAQERLADLLRGEAGTSRTVVIASNCLAALARAASEGWLLAGGRLTPIPCEAAALREAIAAGGTR